MIPLETLPPFFASSLRIEDYDAISLMNIDFRNAVYSDRYMPKLMWFRSELIQTDKILDVGCGHGRESFALLHTFLANEVFGVDIDHEKILEAKNLVGRIRQFQDLLTRLKERIQTHLPWLGDFDEAKYTRERQEYSKQLEAWLQTVPAWLIHGGVPSFYQQDVCENLQWPDNYFDVVYGRNVLHFLKDAQLQTAAKNIARIIKPETGRIIIVEPTRKEGELREFVEPYFNDAGLRLIISETDVDRLGGLDSSDPNPQKYVKYPKGYIYKKPAHG